MPGARETFEQQSKGVGEGWQPIIRRTHTELLDLLGDYELLQIKEKFGGLRYYISAPPGCNIQKIDAIRSIVDAAEDESFTTCEVCGLPGEAGRDGGYWIKTLCENHRAERKIREQ